jgi:hypothetical protein
LAVERDVLRDWHRLFGLLLKDFFTGTPFVVEVERDLSEQQQLLDVVILRRGRGRFGGRLPDGLDGLAAHNLISFKSHREAFDDWAMKELVGHYVAYRKMVSRSPSELLPEEQFRLYVVCARFPHNLAGRVPWQQRQPGVYDCQWATDVIRVIVAGQLAREAHNAPLHLFSASPDLVGFGQGAYRQRSGETNRLLRMLFDSYQEVAVMPFTWEDFERWYAEKYFGELSPEKQREVLKHLSPERRRELLESLPAEERLAGLSPEEIQQYLDRLTAGRQAAPRKPRRKK